MQLRIVSVLAVSLTLLSGCLDSVIPAHDPGTGGGGTTRDEPSLFTTLNAGGYKTGTAFVQLNQTPYASQLDGTQIKMYVSKDAAAAYEAITPESTTTSGPAFPVGGIVVREASDASGKLVAITTMVKRETGYFTGGGDFFFGVLDPSGNPVTDQGQLEWGKVTVCGNCHEPRAATGYLFGVSTANRH